MRLFVIGMAYITVSCSHVAPGAGGTVEDAPKRATLPEVVVPSSSGTLPDLSTLRLSLRQVPSATEVTVELTLANTGPTAVKITKNPRFGDRTFCGRREDEFEIQILDRRGRWVPYQCSDMRGPYHPEEALLQAGQSQTFSLTLMHGCYNLAPGERLSFIATFANLFGEDVTAMKIPKVSASEWIDIAVPPGWKDNDAVQQGIAPDGRSPAAPARR